MFEDILEAIKSRDANVIKGLFSEQALAEAEDIDYAIEYLFDLFDGDVISWERGGLIADGSSRHGKSSYQIKVWYTVYTEKSKYEFLLINYKENMIDPKLKGLYTLYAVDNTDGNTVKGTCKSWRIRGYINRRERINWIFTN